MKKPKKAKTGVMKKWNAYGTVTAGTYIGEFLAETAEEAHDMAIEKAYVSVCHQCADQISDPEVQEVTVEEVTE